MRTAAPDRHPPTPLQATLQAWPPTPLISLQAAPQAPQTELDNGWEVEWVGHRAASNWANEAEDDEQESKVRTLPLFQGLQRCL